MSLAAGAEFLASFAEVLLYVYEHTSMHNVYDSVDLNNNVLFLRI